jgi:hypothetical protein
MKTEELVTMLAKGAAAVDTDSGERRYATAIGWGALGATLLMAILLGVRHDLAQAILLPMFWVKLAYAGCLALASVLAATRLSLPGTRLGALPVALAAPMLAMWALAAVVLLRANPAQRESLFFGATWTTCPFLIALLSVPVFVAIFWAMKGLAPTRLRLAGATGGFASGAIAVVVYSLHCPELTAPFIGFWYLIGMLIPTTAGALLGPQLLRW